MKKLITTILLIILIALLGINIDAMQTEKKEKMRQQEAFNAVIEAVNAMALAWDPSELKTRAHPLMLATFAPGKGPSLDDYFNTLKNLGALMKEITCTPLAGRFINAPQNYTIAEYNCYGSFEKSTAVMGVAVRQDNLTGPWQVTVFKLESPLFNPPAQASAPAQPAAPEQLAPVAEPAAPAEPVAPAAPTDPAAPAQP